MHSSSTYISPIGVHIFICLWFLLFISSNQYNCYLWASLPLYNEVWCNDAHTTSTLVQCYHKKESYSEALLSGAAQIAFKPTTIGDFPAPGEYPSVGLNESATGQVHCTILHKPGVHDFLLSERNEHHISACLNFHQDLHAWTFAWIMIYSYKSFLKWSFK